MKRFSLLLIVIFSVHFVSAQEELICKDVRQLAELERQHHDQILQFRASTFTQNYDLKYHRLEWEINPAFHYISGKVTSYFTPTQDAFNEINFDLEKGMDVQTVTYHGSPVNFSQSADDRLKIELPAKISDGELDSVSVTYSGVPLVEGFGAFFTDTHNEVPVLWTLSEPYGAKTWWPCKQDLTDKIDSIDIIITTPKEYRVGTNGILVSEAEVANDRKVYHWRHRYPIPAYLISLAVTNYAEFSDYVYLENGDSILILNYVYPERLSSAKTQLKSTVRQMELYNELFGTYPFAKEKYGHAQFGWGGGMEHQTMSSIGGFSYGLQAHELAHQWFGNKVTCASWQDIWINEGFATYLTGLTYEFLFSNPANWKNWKASNIRSVTNQPGGSTFVKDTSSINSIFNYRLSYQKGALILHMLRWKLGDEDFFQALRNYLEDPNLAYGYASTDDLKRHLEAVSGENLTEFFADWYYGEGFPSYTIQYTPKISGIKLTLDQTTSHPSVDFFEMPVPIKVYGQNQDTTVVLEHTHSGQTFDIKLSFEPDSLEFDPELWLISRDNEFLEVVSDIDDMIPAPLSVKVSPNPASDIFEITIEDLSLVRSIQSILISDSQGRIFHQLEQIQPSISIDASNWTAGHYFLTFKTGKGHFTRRIVKVGSR